MKTIQEQIKHIDLILKYTDFFVHKDYKEIEINKLLDERLILRALSELLNAADCKPVFC